MPVHIIRVLRELSDRSARQTTPAANYFCKELDNLPPGKWEPNTDICESETHVIIRVELAGVTKEDISVKIKNAKLYISGVRPGYPGSTNVTYHQIEVNCGEFSKIISLPESIAHNEITASLQNGLLEITISKKDQSIEIPVHTDSNLNYEG